MSCDGKPITGICPHCLVTTVHRCVSPLAELYICRCCNKTSKWEEIRVCAGPRREIPAQKGLFS